MPPRKPPPQRKQVVGSAQMTYKDCTGRDGNIYLLRRDQAKEIRTKFCDFVKNELGGI